MGGDTRVGAEAEGEATCRLQKETQKTHSH